MHERNDYYIMTEKNYNIVESAWIFRGYKNELQGYALILGYDNLWEWIKQ